jgi:hypothetical protein
MATNSAHVPAPQVPGGRHAQVPLERAGEVGLIEEAHVGCDPCHGLSVEELLA